MTTYTVYNTATCPTEEVLGGLSLLGAVGRLMRLSECNWWCSRDRKGILHMDIFPDVASVRGALTSANPDDDEARLEIFTRLANGQIILPSKYAIARDAEYRRERPVIAARYAA